MRFKYYRLTLRQMNLKKAFVFFLLVATLVYGFIHFFNKKVEPTLDSICTNHAKKVAFMASNDSVCEYIENIKYDDLINMEKNKDGKIVALTANVSEINKLAANISSQIQKRIEENKEAVLTLPISEIFSIRAVGAKGPKIKVWTMLEGNVDVKFKSNFEEAGINQTRHTIYVEITTNVATISPLYTKENQYVNSILVAESVIVSDIPSSYYQVNGVEGVDKSTVLDVIE